MFNFRYINVFKTAFALVLGLVAFNFSYAVGMLPLPDGAEALYPYNTVGRVTAPDGSSAVGTVVSDKVVITSASQFWNYLNEQQELPVFSFSRESLDSVAQTTSNWTIYAGYDDAVINEGVESVAALSRDLLVLVFDEGLAGDHAILNTDHLDVVDYRKIVGYADDRYYPSVVLRNKLHATSAGEPVVSEFGNVYGRLFHSGNIKSVGGAEGSPVFSFYDGQWAVDGFVVAHDLNEGGTYVVEFDAAVSEFLQEVLLANESVSVPVAYRPSQTDANADGVGATELLLNHGSVYSISPSSDFDYHVVNIPSRGNYTIQSYGELDLTGRLENEQKQKIVSDEDSAGSFNYKIDILLDPGTYYLRTFPYSSEVSGLYGISFTSNDVVESYLDDGVLVNSFQSLSLNSLNGKYQIASNESEDVFRITVEQAGQFVLTTDAEFDLQAELLLVVPGATLPLDETEIQMVVAKNDDASGLRSNVLLDAFLPVGDYVIVVEPRVSGEFGPYELDTAFLASSVFNGSANPVGGALSNAISYSIDEVVDGEIVIDHEIDAFRFDLLSSGSVSLALEGDYPLSMMLFDSNFNLVQGSGSLLDVSYLLENVSLTVGRYYLVLTSDQEVSYRFSLTTSAE